MDKLQLFLFFYFGACIGSFLNVVILRLPEEKSLQGRSACPNCGHKLGILELFPILSFLWLGMRCSSCKQKISWRYFCIEVLTGSLFLVAWLMIWPITTVGILLLIRACLIISLMIAVFVVDLEHYIILDEVVIFGAVTGIIINFALSILTNGLWLINGYFISGLIGALASVSPFFLLWYFSKGKWMGFGDVKLSLLLGLLLGWPLVGVSLFLAVMLGGLVSCVLLITRIKGLKSALPFGTFLSVAVVITLFFGTSLLNWYLSILGF